jgi:7-cyano-7-deazaguanine reductase
MSVEINSNGLEPKLETVIVGEAKGPGVLAPSKLGEGKTVPTKQLDSFENPAPDFDYTIVLEIPEFTCLCPISGQPDFARFTIEDRPDHKCVETKSLKLYMWSFRNEGAFHEAVTNSILRDLVKVLEPKWIKITGVFNARGGITPTIISQWEKPQSA